MLRKMTNKNSFLLYTSTAAIIVGWWLFAFYVPNQVIPPIPKPSARISISNAALSDRNKLRDALLGDVEAMRYFLVQWDQENQLNDTTFLTEDEVDCALGLCEKLKNPAISQGDRYFPQTFNSASFLLALVCKDQICSLPEGLRRYPDLYPDEVCCAIPSESNRYRAEKISLQNPQAAFVSSYSDPYTVEMLQQQGIDVVSLESANTLEAIQNGILSVGQTTKQQDKAQLLSLFIKAAMQTLDNRARSIMEQRSGTFALVYFQMGIQVPTTKSLTGYLLQRIGIDVIHNPVTWRVPMSEEKLIAASPESLIVITDEPDSAHKQLLLSPAIRDLDAVKQGRLCYISNHVQHQSNQFVVMAYLDLVEAMRI